MNNINKIKHNSSASVCRILYWLILVIGIASRIYQFGSVPLGLHRDEAFAGYEAWSLLNYGTDSWGYHNPVYLAAWGDGMNALNTYLMIPFIAIFGLKTWVIRLPQLIVGVLSVPATFSFVNHISTQKTDSLLAMLIIAVCPWHIMLSRWGLESNLAPGFILFGLLFFVKSFDSKWYLPLSAIMFGCSLYAYATIWISIPIILALACLYCYLFKKIRFDRYVLLFSLILFIFALPLILFIAVNKDIIPEIKLSFISIPRMVRFRSNEYSFSFSIDRLKNLFYMILYGTDGHLWSSPEKFGLLYKFSLPFTIIGGISCIIAFIKSIRLRTFQPFQLFLYGYLLLVYSVFHWMLMQ